MGYKNIGFTCGQLEDLCAYQSKGLAIINSFQSPLFKTDVSKMLQSVYYQSANIYQSVISINTLLNAKVMETEFVNEAETNLQILGSLLQ